MIKNGITSQHIIVDDIIAKAIIINLFYICLSVLQFAVNSMSVHIMHTLFQNELVTVHSNQW